MADVVVFHHCLGLTDGLRRFADRLRRAGHSVHTPDLYAGRTFDTIADGMAHAEQIGFPEGVVDRAERSVAEMAAGLVYVGFSLGVVPAQKLAQTRAGAAGAVLCHSCLPLEVFGGRWPDGVPVQVHGMEADPYFVDEGDLDAARHLVAAVEKGELFVYPGDQHLFADSSLPSYRQDAAELLTERVLRFVG